MRNKLWAILVICLLVLPALRLQAEKAEEKETVVQDQKLLHFASRVLPWYPDSFFSMKADLNFKTPSGSYRIVQVDRRSASKVLSGSTNFFLDEPSDTIWIANAARLPDEAKNMNLDELKSFVGSFLPELLMKNMRMRARIDWEVNQKEKGPSTLIPFKLMVDSGYGEYEKHGGVTVDASFVLLGAPFPYDKDPVSYRNGILQSSPLLMRDHPNSKAKVNIVEFSDFECPGCRVKWAMIKSQLMKHGNTLSHGMVNYPIPAIHPWAFRAASAAWCFSQQDAEKLLDFKEHFYNLQRNMEVSIVTETATDFVAGVGLDTEAFKNCYLKEASIQAVHHQMELGHSLGVAATPTYFFNGWMIQVPEAYWLDDFVKTLLAGEIPAVGIAK